MFFWKDVPFMWNEKRGLRGDYLILLGVEKGDVKRWIGRFIQNVITCKG